MNTITQALIKRSFSSAAVSGSTKQTSLYLWTSMPRLGPKATELKQQLVIPKGTPQRVAVFDNLSVAKIMIGLRHSAALSSKH